MISVPATASGSRVVRRKRETLAMLGSASPRKPRVAIAARSAAVRILLVAWRSSESKRVVAIHSAAVVDYADQAKCRRAE